MNETATNNSTHTQGEEYVEGNGVVYVLFRAARRIHDERGRHGKEGKSCCAPQSLEPPLFVLLSENRVSNSIEYITNGRKDDVSQQQDDEEEPEREAEGVGELCFGLTLAPDVVTAGEDAVQDGLASTQDLPVRRVAVGDVLQVVLPAMQVGGVYRVSHYLVSDHLGHVGQLEPHHLVGTGADPNLDALRFVFVRSRILRETNLGRVSPGFGKTAFGSAGSRSGRSTVSQVSVLAQRQVTGLGFVGVFDAVSDERVLRVAVDVGADLDHVLDGVGGDDE